MAIGAMDAGAPYGPTPRRHSGATTEHAACRSPAQETSRAATMSPPCPSFASPAAPRSPPTTSARHRRSDPSGPHRSPAPKWGASDGLMRGRPSPDARTRPTSTTRGWPCARRTICPGDAGSARNGASMMSLSRSRRPFDAQVGHRVERTNSSRPTERDRVRRPPAGDSASAARERRTVGPGR